MIYKKISLSLAFTFLLSGHALADNVSSLSDSDLEQCRKIAEMTPLDIFSRTQEGVSTAYDELAQNCFKQNACSSLTDVDKPTCARSLALNSYLIQVAYNTHGPAYPPYSTQLSEQTQPKIVGTTETQNQPVYNNLAPPPITEDTSQTKDSTEATINWS
jgi:hypothetical protein